MGQREGPFWFDNNKYIFLEMRENKLSFIEKELDEHLKTNKRTFENKLY